jgi:hypothetical protein
MKQILLDADQLIKCPHCAREFQLSTGISSQAIRNYEDRFEQWKQAQASLVRKDLEAAAEKTLKQAREKALQEAAAEKKALEEELAEKNRKVREFQETELALRREKKQVEEARAAAELDLQRKLDEETKKIEERVRASASEQFRLREAEYQKKIADAQKSNDDLKRKLEQGSQQLQGEVLEMEIEDRLKQAFPVDLVEQVKKGVRGADVTQSMRSSTGQTCGKILWEAKRAENWSDKWIAKLKEDQQEARADVAVLVTTNMPNEIKEPMTLVDGVLVVKPDMLLPAAAILRRQLIEIYQVRLANAGKGDKKEILYNYLNSAPFAQHVRAVIDAFITIKSDLDSEKRAMTKHWKKREVEIERVMTNMMGMVGELQAIAQMPQLDGVAELDQLPEHQEPAE